MIIFLICLVVHLQEPSWFAIAAGQDHQSECEPTSCSAPEPIVRFPFRLKDRQSKHCGYPGFDLSCNSNNSTEFEFQFPVRASARNIILPIRAKATVTEIDYKTQLIRVRVFNGSSLPKQVPKVNFSASPFEINFNTFDMNGGDEYNLYTYGYTLFNCSTRPLGYYVLGPILGFDHHVGFQVYADASADMFVDLPGSSCVTIYNISYVPEVILGEMEGPNFDDPQLHWSKPSCGSCELKGNYCRFKNNGPNNETECYETPEQAQQKKKIGISKNVVIAVVVVGVFVMLLLAATLYSVYSVKKRKRDNQRKIDHFLEDYKALRPSRYTYSDIKKITDGFKYKLGQGGFGTVYKGQLSNEIPVAVKVLSSMKGNGEDFINEVGTIGKIHHVNVVRLIGYCADGYRRALVYEFLENDSLQKYISSGNQSSSLGWEKLHEIALGIAKGLDYLHQGCNQRILHFDIKPHNILLDHNLNPKVADFGLAKLCSKEKSMVTMTAARGTIGYIAPEVFSRNFGNVSYKSDIYSYGMLLLDMVGGRKKFFARAEDSDDQAYFPEWIYNQLEKGKEIAIEIEKGEESNIVRRLTIVGLWCIQWYPADRPSTKVVIQMLEGENMPIMPPNPFDASESVNTKSIFCGSICSSAQTSLTNY